MVLPEMLRVNTSKLSAFMTERVQTRPGLLWPRDTKTWRLGRFCHEVIKRCDNLNQHQLPIWDSACTRNLALAFLSKIGSYLQSKDCHLEMKLILFHGDCKLCLLFQSKYKINIH